MSELRSKYGVIDYDAIAVNRTFHDHECHYYDERFAIVHDARAARQAVAEVEELLGRPLARRERILDAGCGTGFLAAGLRRARPDLRVVGSDLSQGMLAKARAAGAWPLIQADATALPVRDDAVDLVVARGVLHHLPDVTAALAEWRRVLRPGGAVVLLSEPTPAVERHGAVLARALLATVGRGALPPHEHHWEMASMASNLHVFTPAELAGLAAAAGFGRVDLHSSDFLDTLLITASYITWGRAPRLARLVPWRAADALARRLDRSVVHRVMPAGLRHTVVGVLRD
ncbi:MAG TPA: methyltransferase domain-containing protein [Mycobacteriales bacterium]|nr:methyltransferase domain-containing protein [Mycobacteriales bacterium]